MKKLTSLLVVFIFLIQSAFVRTRAGPFDGVCNNTPHPTLCESILEADPMSPQADRKGRAIIMVGEVELKASDALQETGRLSQSKPLSDCKEYYVAVVGDIIPQAEDAINADDAGKATQLMNDVIGKTDSCEHGFQGASPMTNLNNAVKDVASVAAALSSKI